MDSLIAQCCQAGISEWIVCPGSPLDVFSRILNIVPQLVSLEISHSRAAAFYALGRITSSRKPVALVIPPHELSTLSSTLSTTPFLGKPLLIVTFADQASTLPPEHSLPPPALATLEISDTQNMPSLREIWDSRSVFHLSIAHFETPQTPSPPPPIHPFQTPRFPRPRLANLAQTLREERHLAIVMGAIMDPDDQDAACWLAQQLKVPVLAEATSGLREELDRYVLRQGDAILQRFTPRVILRLGDVPTGTFWQALNQRPDISVFSLTRTTAPGLTRPSEVICCPLKTTIQALGDVQPIGNNQELLRYSRKRGALIDEAIRSYDRSEASLLHAISQYACLSDQLLISSDVMSLWDEYAQREIPTHSVHLVPQQLCFDEALSLFWGISSHVSESWYIGSTTSYQLDMGILHSLPISADQRRIIVILSPQKNKDQSALQFHVTAAQQSSICRTLIITSLEDFDQLETLPATGTILIVIRPNAQHSDAFQQMTALF